MEGKKRGDEEERRDENFEARRGVETKREVMAVLGLGGSGLRGKKREKRELTRKMSTKQRKTTESSNI